MARRTLLEPDIETTLIAEITQEKGKLRKNFRRFDIFFFLICALVGVDTIGSAASKGAESFTWLVVLAAIFFIPYGLIAAELGSTFTAEGGCLVWAQLAFGDLAAAITAVFYWISVPIWLGGALVFSALAASDAFFAPLKGSGRFVFGFVYVWVTVLATILNFKVGKWIPILGAWARFIVLSFFTVTVGLYAAKNGVHGFHLHNFSPTYAMFITIAPVLVYNYIGFELPSSAGDEMTDPQKDVPFAVSISAVGAILLYGLPILAILLVLPQDRVSGLSGFIDAIKAVFTVYGGTVTKDTVTLTGAGRSLGWGACILFIMSLISSGTTWLMGGDRVMAVAGYSGIAPRCMGRISEKFGTPVFVNVLSGIAATITMLIAFSLSGEHSQDSKKYFDAVLGLAISTSTLSYFAVFPAAIKLRYTHADVARPYRIPWGNTGMWICGTLSTIWMVLATVALIWPGVGVGWFGSSGNPDASLPSKFARMEYEWTQILPLIPIVLLGFVFYAVGRANLRREAEQAEARKI